MLRFAFFLVLFCNYALAEQSLTDRFNESFRQSQSLVKEGKVEEALVAAKLAVNLGSELELDQEDQANLEFNLGFLLLNSRRYPEACETFQSSLDNYEAVFGKNNARLINNLDALGACFARILGERRTSAKYFRRAQKIAKKSFGKQSEQYAKASFRIGQAMVMQLQMKEGRRHLEESVEVYSQLKGAGSEEAQAGLFNLAKYNLGIRQYETAAEILNEISNNFAAPLSPANRFELSVHGFLVEAYEQTGKSDAATKHCLAIGKMTPAQETQDYIPIFKALPKYPFSALQNGKEGSVVIEFDVDEQGFVRDPRVVSREGSRIFDDPSLEVAKKFRYAPRFIDGNPVKTYDVQNRVVYSINR